MSWKSFFSSPQLSVKQFRLLLLLLWVALVVPSLFLVYQTRQQLQWESFYHFRNQATELAQRLDGQLQNLIAEEEARPFTDYQFLVQPDAKNNFARRSPLSQFPVQSALPGVIGYFQLDANGNLSTPVLPQDLKELASIGADELAARTALRDRILAVLAENDQIKQRQVGAAQKAAPAAPVAAELAMSSTQRAFNSLSIEKTTAKKAYAEADKIKGLKLDESLNKSAPAAVAPKQKLEEAFQAKDQLEGDLVADAKKQVNKPAREESKKDLRVRTFESEVNAFDLMKLENGYLMLFRNVWHENARYIQGVILDQQRFLAGAMIKPYLETSLSQMSKMAVVYDGNVIDAVGAEADSKSNSFSTRGYDSSRQELKGTLLEQSRLLAPLGQFQLIWAIEQLPLGPGAKIVAWSSLILFSVLCAGFLLLYRLGVKQIKLVQQQQNFVSSVSHELKTPLTSIRMYSEILREGWLTDDKKMQYYSFIHDESERLSRLIANVLQLARLGRQDLQLDVKPYSVGVLLDMQQSKLASALQRGGFELSVSASANCKAVTLEVDADAFTQVMINLVDNAVKFAANSAVKRVDFVIELQANHLIWQVRDYGPGIPSDETSKIFQLFYRLGDELTRETTGTGIGLALVKQLVDAMGGRISVENANPGARFNLVFTVNE